MKLNLLHAFLVANTALLSACASTSTPSPRSVSELIKPGMTREQVIRIAGHPQNRHSGLTGHGMDEVWIYSDGMLNAVPFVGAVRGARTNMTQVSFHKGKVTLVGVAAYGGW